jgi:hypothetical protein
LRTAIGTTPRSESHPEPFSGSDIVFQWGNLNLLHTNTEQNTATYHDPILSNGYLQTITKATGIQNSHFSLIDHILTNSPSTESQAGILLSDISDHFFTFILPDYNKQHQPPATYTTRDFSTANIENFKQALRATTWQSTFNSNTAIQNSLEEATETSTEFATF